MKYLFLALILTGCSSTMPVLPKTSDVKVSRQMATGECESLGTVVGNSVSIKEDKETMLEDLKQEAIKKGANFVKIETLGAQGTAIKGEAYFCK